MRNSVGALALLAVGLGPFAAEAKIYDGVTMADVQGFVKTSGFSGSVSGQTLTVAGATPFTIEFPGCAAEPCSDMRLKAVFDKSAGGEQTIQEFNELSTSFSTAFAFETGAGKAALVADVVTKGATGENLVYNTYIFTTLINELAGTIGSDKFIDAPPEPNFSPKGADAASVRTELSSADIARILSGAGFTTEVVSSPDGTMFVRVTKEEFQWAVTAGVARSAGDASDVIMFRTPPVAATTDPAGRIAAWNNAERWISVYSLGGNVNGFMPIVLTGGITEAGFAAAAGIFHGQARKFADVMKAAPSQ